MAVVGKYLGWGTNRVKAMIASYFNKLGSDEEMQGGIDYD